MKRAKVLFRESFGEYEELEVCKQYFETCTFRSQIQKGDFVIPRYSSLPYYRELEVDVQNLGGELINSYHQHLYVADIKNWYYDLKEYTPKTWFDISTLPDEGYFVLKGSTNSKKHQWRTHMFAASKQEAILIESQLARDGLLCDQEIVAREYVPLLQYGIGLQGLPITEEYRFFVIDKKILTGAFYWSEHTEFLEEEGFIQDYNEVPREFLKDIIEIVSPNIRFYVIDVARTRNDSWILIELNDGTMSGLSDNSPHDLYQGLKTYFKKGD